jgi:alpha-tubulin suppressor-like RCC1 family protein
MRKRAGIHAAAILIGLSLSCSIARAEFVPTVAWSVNATRQMVQALASGSAHACVRIQDGTVQCWGNNASGQLGDGTTIDRSSPIRVGLSGIVSLAAGLDHTCALDASGRVWCWGGNAAGQLGDGTTAPRPFPVRLSTLANVVALAAGLEHTCALLGGGAVRCWGANELGQLGDGTRSRRLLPTAVVKLANVKAIVAGQFHSCALVADGSAACWGSNHGGQLGDGTTTNRETPAAVPGLARVTSLAAGWGHTCALRSTAEVLCWGFNEQGQLGDGTLTRRLIPTGVVDLRRDVVALSAHFLHTCALTSGGRILCWGENERGQLGDGSTLNRARPVFVVPPRLFGATTSFVGVAAGERHTCGSAVMGTVHCWGANELGQLGDNASSGSVGPTLVVGIIGSIAARAISAGDINTCALRANGTVSCWAVNVNGELGRGTTDTDVHPPSAVPSLTDVVAIEVGGDHACAVIVSGRVRCWGGNDDGQVGRGQTSQAEPTPMDVGLTNIVAVSAALNFSCALTANGRVFCWGDNADGQLGTAAPNQAASPILVAGIQDAVAIATGSENACALIADGTARCWGEIFGGPGSFVDFQGSVPFAALGLGFAHFCKLGANGAMTCRGDNGSGQLGDGTQNPSVDFVQVTGLSGATAGTVAWTLTSATAHNCVLVPFGSARCWGRNTSGQLGNGSEEDEHLTPVGVAGLAALVGVSAGGSHTCALRFDGVPFCWGFNLTGALGVPVIVDGVVVSERRTPVEVPSFRFNIAPTAEVSHRGKQVDVTILASCEEGARAELRVTLTQGGAEAQGRATGRCVGRLEPYPLEVKARDAVRFDAGNAEAEAEIVVQRHGQAQETLRWSRTIRLESVPDE